MMRCVAVEESPAFKLFSRQRSRNITKGVSSPKSTSKSTSKRVPRPRPAKSTVTDAIAASIVASKLPSSNDAKGRKTAKAVTGKRSSVGGSRHTASDKKPRGRGRASSNRSNGQARPFNEAAQDARTATLDAEIFSRSSRACRAAQQTPHLWGEWEAQQGGAGGATARLAVMPRDRASSGHTINNGTPNPAMVPAAATAFMSVSAANALSPRTMPAPAPGSVRRDAGHGTGFANQGWTNQMLAMASVALLGGSGRMAAGGDARHVAVPSVPEMALQVQVRREDEGGRRPSGLFCRGCAAVHEWCAAVVCCRVCCSA